MTAINYISNARVRDSRPMNFNDFFGIVFIFYTGYGLRIILVYAAAVENDVEI